MALRAGRVPSSAGDSGEMPSFPAAGMPALKYKSEHKAAAQMRRFIFISPR